MQSLCCLPPGAVIIALLRIITPLFHLLIMNLAKLMVKDNAPKKSPC